MAQQGDRRFFTRFVELLFLGGRMSATLARCSRVVMITRPGLSAASSRNDSVPGLSASRTAGRRVGITVVRCRRDEQGTMLTNQPGESLATFVRAALGRVGITEEFESP